MAHYKCLNIQTHMYLCTYSHAHTHTAVKFKAITALGLRQRDRESSRLGIFDGKQMVFDGSRWGMLTLGQLLWRYGWDIYRMQSFVDKMLANFRR